MGGYMNKVQIKTPPLQRFPLDVTSPGPEQIRGGSSPVTAGNERPVAPKPPASDPADGKGTSKPRQ